MYNLPEIMSSICNKAASNILLASLDVFVRKVDSPTCIVFPFFSSLLPIANF